MANANLYGIRFKRPPSLVGKGMCQHVVPSCCHWMSQDVTGCHRNVAEMSRKCRGPSSKCRGPSPKCRGGVAVRRGHVAVRRRHVAETSRSVAKRRKVSRARRRHLGIPTSLYILTGWGGLRSDCASAVLSATWAVRGVSLARKPLRQRPNSPGGAKTGRLPPAVSNRPP